MVPFISKRALGLVSGFVGAGGNTGSAITQALFFAGSFEWAPLLLARPAAARALPRARGRPPLPAHRDQPPADCAGHPPPALRSMSTQDGMVYMGYMIIGMTSLLVLVYFPMVGSHFFSHGAAEAGPHACLVPPAALPQPPPGACPPAADPPAAPLLPPSPAPQWGGMLFPAKDGVSEEDYYMAEWSAEEKAAGGLRWWPLRVGPLPAA